MTKPPRTNNDEEAGEAEAVADPKPDHRKVYMAGWYAGRKASDQGGSDMMNAAEYARREMQQTGTAKRVLQAVPITEVWSSKQIAGEIARTTHVDYRVVIGCLNTLKEAGLIQEPLRGYFQRARVREASTPPLKAIAAPPAPAVATTPPPAPPPAPNSAVEPLDKLSHCIDRLRALGVGFDTAAKSINDAAAGFKALADEFETALIEYETSTDDQQKEREKLQQLRALLKEL